MKLQPLFTVKANKLYTIDENNGNPLNLEFADISDLQIKPDMASGSFYRIIIEQKIIEPEPECYDESFLAALRDFLKQFEENRQFAVLHIIPGKTVSVAGVEFVSEFIDENAESKISFLIDELKVKHAQYVYFIKENDKDKISLLEDEYKDVIVLEK